MTRIFHDDAVTAELEKTLGYVFADKSLLEMALTHPSLSNELKSRSIRKENNQRLEFFGDSVLSYIVSEHLYGSYPDLPEGELSKVRASVVCETTLAKFAREIGLGDCLLLGRGEELTGGREKNAILADAFEALLAAMYLDGGIEPVKAFLLPIETKEIAQVVKSGSTKDYKTALQQFVQQEAGDVLEYRLVSETGPMHSREFEVAALLNSNVVGRGKGSSKRAAEQNAAKEALALFGVKDA